MKNSDIAKFSFVGFLLFLLPLTLTVAGAVVISELVMAKFNSYSYLVPFLVLYVLFVATAFSLFDILRRRLLVDRPVNIILDATERIASGDFSVNCTPLHEYGKYDEYDRIMENINKVARELESTELLKTDFVSNVSHEIKTPLAIIINYSRALKKGGLDEETKQKYLDALVQTSNRISSLVTNVLKLNKLENQKVLPAKERVDLVQILSECVIANEEKIESKSLELSCDLDEVVMLTDGGFMEIIFSNVINNAVKFSKEGGRIRISLHESAEQVEFSVRDNGIGMDEKTGAHIFDKFYQGETSHSGEGNGLGLALVKRIIDILGGTIRVRSVKGEGTTFTVTLKK